MLIQKLFRYLMFAWIALLLFLMLALKSSMILVNNNSNSNDRLSLFDLFFNSNNNEQIDFLLQEKLTNQNNNNNVAIPIQLPQTEKVIEPVKTPPSEWVEIPLNKTMGNAKVKDVKVVENESSVDIIFTYDGELGGYSGTSIFSKEHKNLIVGKFVDLYGSWNHVAKNFYHKKDTTQDDSIVVIYKKIMVYDHKGYLRITLESPNDKYTTENVIKVKVQQNTATNEAKISFYY